MNISPQINLDSFEELITSYRHTPSGTLRIPSGLLYGGGIGLEASVFLAITTWANSEFHRTLKLWVAGAEVGPHLNSVMRTLYGVSASYLAGTVEDKQSMPLEKKYVLGHATAMMNDMYRGKYSELLHGPTINLFCVRRAENEFLRGLYSKDLDGAVRERWEFEKLAERLLALCVPESVTTHARSRLAKPIGEVAYELFKNTDQHSLYDAQGNNYRKHIRGLTIRFRKIAKNEVPRISGTSPITSPYFARLALSNEQKPTLSILELSVFDSGPGMARRWLSHQAGTPVSDLDSLDIGLEFEAIKNCFLAHSSTKATESSGEGLDLVTKLLWKYDGFLRVRTGRLCLFQSFNAKRDYPGFAPGHWFRRQALGCVEGTAVTVCLPLPTD